MQAAFIAVADEGRRGDIPGCRLIWISASSRAASDCFHRVFGAGRLALMESEIERDGEEDDEETDNGRMTFEYGTQGGVT